MLSILGQTWDWRQLQEGSVVMPATLFLLRGDAP